MVSRHRYKRLPYHPVIRPKPTGDDWDIDYERCFITDLMVEEEIEAEYTVSKLVDHYGFPIIYAVETEKQGFIGFLKPSWADDNYADATEEEEDE